MKTKILAALRETEGYLSGQELCERFQVSRTAIWKRIRQLQEEGYEIEAVPNKGYRLTGYPDTIAADEVESRLETKWIARPVRYFDTISSTNQYAKQVAEEGHPEGILIVADEQTRGRGRLGRSWSTPHATAIAMTLMLRPQLLPDRISMVTLVMGMAICQAVRTLYGLDARIKWPNDVVIEGKKVCGILTEMSTEISAVNYVVIGVGINANVRTFPEELADRAISLCTLVGEDVNRAQLIAVSMKWFETYYEQFLITQDLSGLQAAYEEMMINRGRVVRVLDPAGAFTGTAEGISPRGELLVRREDGTLSHVYAGEVSVRGVYGYV